MKEEDKSEGQQPIKDKPVIKKKLTSKDVQNKAFIVDREAYQDYVRVRNFLKREVKDQVFETSIPGVVVDFITQTEGQVRKRCIDLPYEEREKILKMFMKYKGLKKKVEKLKRKAYGVPVKGESCLSKLEKIKDQVLQLYGRGWSVLEVHRHVNTELGVRVYKNALVEFRKRNVDTINQLQLEYQKDYSELRLVNKKSRVEELSLLFMDRKMRYEKSRSQADYALLLKTLDQIKKEVEGDLVIKGGIDINVSAQNMLTDFVNSELMRTIPIKEIIISRIAAKTDSNPLFLMSRLTSSIYAKFTGFRRATSKQLQETSPDYPSMLIYDFDKIEREAREREIEKKKLIELPESVATPDVVDIFKSQLIDKIKGKQKEVDKKELDSRLTGILPSERGNLDNVK